MQYEANSDETPSEAIIEALSEATGVDEMELPALYGFVDPDAVDALFERHNGTGEMATVLGFTVDTWNIFVRADGRIRICDATTATEPAPVFETKTTTG